MKPVILVVSGVTIFMIWWCPTVVAMTYADRRYVPEGVTPTTFDHRSKPPLVLMQSGGGASSTNEPGSNSRRRPRAIGTVVESTTGFCEDTENPCTCCCIDCWEYGNTKYRGVCYLQCRDLFTETPSSLESCDCNKLRLADYD